MGPRIEPWGSPQDRGEREDWELPSLTKKNFSLTNMTWTIPRHQHNALMDKMRVAWSTVSKAAVRFKNIRTAASPESIVKRILLKTLQSADSVESFKTRLNIFYHVYLKRTAIVKVLFFSFFEIKGSFEITQNTWSKTAVYNFLVIRSNGLPGLFKEASRDNVCGTGRGFKSSDNFSERLKRHRLKLVYDSWGSDNYGRVKRRGRVTSSREHVHTLQMKLEDKWIGDNLKVSQLFEKEHEVYSNFERQCQRSVVFFQLWWFSDSFLEDFIRNMELILPPPTPGCSGDVIKPRLRFGFSSHNDMCSTHLRFSGPHCDILSAKQAEIKLLLLHVSLTFRPKEHGWSPDVLDPSYPIILKAILTPGKMTSWSAWNQSEASEGSGGNDGNMAGIKKSAV